MNSLSEEAKEFVKRNKKQIITRVAGDPCYKNEEIPLSLFMAGSPGAGKTEFSLRMIDLFKGSDDPLYLVRIDPDDIRTSLPEYNGRNAELFQGAISLAVEKVHDHVLETKKNFVLDGTLSNYEKSRNNILRSLQHNRVVIIIYLYLDPKIAWEFTKARERKDGRNIPKEVFIKDLFLARRNVSRLKAEFKNEISVTVAVKKDLSHNVNIYQNIDDIDNIIKFSYSEDELMRIL